MTHYRPRPGEEHWVPSCFVERVLAARSRVPAHIPFLLTEYSVMVGEGMAARRRLDPRDGSAPALAEADGPANDPKPPFQHDGPGAAAFVLRVVPQLAPLAMGGAVI
jgi:hypothetical protein